MGKQSNKSKSDRQDAALVHAVSKGGITVQAKRAFSPTLTPLVVQAFFYFIHDQVGEGMKAIAQLQSHGCDFFDFTMASTGNPQLGDADPLMWAWAAGSEAALRWLTAVCLERHRFDLNFLAILPHQLELAEEGSERCRFGSEIFAMVASHLMHLDGGFDLGVLLAHDALRANAICKKLVAERLAVDERAVLADCTAPVPCSHPMQSGSTVPADRNPQRL